MLKIVDDTPLPETEEKRLTLDSGAEVVTETTAGHERIRVYGVFETGRELVFEYDPVSHRTSLRVPEGDLELASRGNINLQAEGEVRLHGRGAVGLSAGDTSVQVRPGRLALWGKDVEMVAKSARLALEETTLAGKRLRARVDDVRSFADRVETTADRVVTSAVDLVQKVDGLLYTRAGRMRTLVDGAVHLKGRMLVLKADKDAKVKGEKIYLG